MFLMKNDVRPLSPDDFPPPLFTPYHAIQATLSHGKIMLSEYFSVLDMMVSKIVGLNLVARTEPRNFVFGRRETRLIWAFMQLITMSIA